MSYFAIKSKIKGKLRKFLILTGGSAAGFVIFSVLHNFFYALGIISEKIIVLKYIFEALHVAAFFVAILVFPIAFLVGMIGSIVLMIRKK